MTTSALRRAAALALLALVFFQPLVVQAQFHEEIDPTEISVSGKTPESIILSWPTFSYRLARLMIARYGQPAEARDASLIWRDNGPWKETIVYRDPPSERHEGRLEQTVAYGAPADKLDALARFDKEIEADVKDGSLTARSDAERENFLALNLAVEVLKGRRTPQEASDFRRKLSRLETSGKASSYLSGLMFDGGDQGPDPESPH